MYVSKLHGSLSKFFARLLPIVILVGYKAALRANSVLFNAEA